MNRKKEETSTRLSPIELEKYRAERRAAAMKKALEADKVVYKSSSSPGRFKEFLQDRLKIWSQVKDKTFHGKKMYEKTNAIIESLTSSE